MVRCHVCGKEVFSGWVCGVISALEKDKFGLCVEHNTMENRRAAYHAWQEHIFKEVRGTLKRVEKQAAPPVSYEVIIHFMDGGIKTMSASMYDVNEKSELLVVKLDGGLEFYPLQHIRKFHVNEVGTPGEAGASAPDET